MRFLFTMDPHGMMSPDQDTSFAFMRGAQARGHECWHCLIHEVFNEGREVFAKARPLRVEATAPHVVAGNDDVLRLSDVDAVLVRKDPPFDSAYLHLTQQLELLRGKTLLVNDPRALRDANEKLFAFTFYEYMPRTMVSADTGKLLEFLKGIGGRGVVKPLDGAGGSGVMGLNAADRNSRGIVDFVTREGTELAMVQEFIPDVVGGDKRVLLLAGQELGTIRRVPRPDDIRANIHVGGQVEAATLTPAEQELVAHVGPVLAERGLYFVGLDLIAERLIEVNVTSPTGIQELGRLTDTQPELRVITWLEDQVRRLRT
jgi:glutathione synthase